MEQTRRPFPMIISAVPLRGQLQERIKRLETELAWSAKALDRIADLAAQDFDEVPEGQEILTDILEIAEGEVGR